VARLPPALLHRNYRLYFAGQCVSLAGTWAQQVALEWLVYRLSGDPFLLGLTVFAGRLPTLLLAPLGGVLTDRWDRRRTLLVTQSLGMAQAIALAALAFADAIAVWQVLLLTACLGIVNAVDMTAREALLPQLVDRREHLGSAVALHSLMVNAAQFAGPLLAGWLIARTGEWACFLVNGVSYFAALAVLTAIRLPPRGQPAALPRLLHSLGEGLRYTFGNPPLRSVLLLLAATSLLGMSHAVLMPVVAVRLLHGGPETLGLLTAAPGVGALLGAAVLSFRGRTGWMHGWLALLPAVYGAGLLCLPDVGCLALALPVLLVMGLVKMLQLAASRTILQTLAAEDFRGRVMSYYTVAFLGMLPLGSLLAGWLADRVGVASALRLFGLACLAAAAAFAGESIVRGRDRQVKEPCSAGKLPQAFPDGTRVKP
jgi:MFS family permease